MASATAPANPVRIFPPAIARTLWACAFMTVSPTVTCPSPPIATLPLRRTARMVVARTRGRGLMAVSYTAAARDAERAEGAGTAWDSRGRAEGGRNSEARVREGEPELRLTRRRGRAEHRRGERPATSTDG